MAYAALVLTAIVAFLLGSIPFGILVGTFVYKTDIRSVGSGNIGTTNAIRALGFKGGAIVFLLDFGKGILSGLAAWAFVNLLAPSAMLESSAFPAVKDYLATAFFCCTFGHVFSPWLKFKGGKGIAVASGCQFPVYGPLWAILELVVFGVLVALTRYVSVGSIVAGLLCIPLSLFLFWGHPFAIALGCTTGLLVVWAHRGNIERLLNGTENRVGSSKKSETGE